MQFTEREQRLIAEARGCRPGRHSRSGWGLLLMGGILGVLTVVLGVMDLVGVMDQVRGDNGGRLATGVLLICLGFFAFGYAGIVEVAFGIIRKAGLGGDDESGETP